MRRSVARLPMAKKTFLEILYNLLFYFALIRGI